MVRSRTRFAIPTSLAMVVASGAIISGCPSPTTVDASIDADVATVDASTDTCMAINDVDGALQYIECPLNNGCAQVTYPDGYSFVGLC
jgi:hypothetical protein